MENQYKYPRRVISILAVNRYGVLARISNMFNRRSFNIDSITTSETMDPGIANITITVHVDEQKLKQLLLQKHRQKKLLLKLNLFQNIKGIKKAILILSKSPFGY